MRLLFSLIVTALTFFSLEAQQLSLGGNSWVANFKKASDEVNNQEEKLKYSEIKGTPYYKADFESAKFDDTPTVAPIRYNTFLDVVEILIDNNIYEIPREATPKKFTFTKTNERLVVVDTHDEYAGYFFEIADGKYKILKKIKTKFYGAVPSKTHFAAGTVSRFESQRPLYFIKAESSEVITLKNTKDLLTYFPEKKDELNNFLKTNKIKLTEESDLVKLAQFINN